MTQGVSADDFSPDGAGKPFRPKDSPTTRHDTRESRLAVGLTGLRPWPPSTGGRGRRRRTTSAMRVGVCALAGHRHTSRVARLSPYASARLSRAYVRLARSLPMTTGTLVAWLASSAKQASVARSQLATRNWPSGIGHWQRPLSHPPSKRPTRVANRNGLEFQWVANPVNSPGTPKSIVPKGSPMPFLARARVARTQQGLRRCKSNVAAWHFVYARA
jgi:hypothetical protein